jgi:hypothetical protein
VDSDYEAPLCSSTLESMPRTSNCAATTDAVDDSGESAKSMVDGRN